MTKDEQEVLALLGRAENKFRLLPELHPSDLPEMQLYIHAAQNIVLARGALRAQANAGVADPRQ